jgi:hypothetical protein
VKVGKGWVSWLREDPVALTASAEKEARFVEGVKGAAAAAGFQWSEANHLLLRRGPYIIAAGLEESIAGEPILLSGRFVNLFDANLQVVTEIRVTAGSRYFLLDLSRISGNEPRVLASACKALVTNKGPRGLSMAVEGVEGTPAVILIYSPRADPREITLMGKPLDRPQDSSVGHLLWLRFANQSSPRELKLTF